MSLICGDTREEAEMSLLIVSRVFNWTK